MIDFLKENSQKSTTRLVVIALTVGPLLVQLGMLIRIIICCFNDCKIEWSQMALLYPAMAMYIASILYPKVMQKKIENDSKKTL